ncbi:MAG TPA: hypothetical protein VKV96_08725, partial [Roseiarcus sp.]|nr:hypothetical protein [Roseiarcus sp.]
MRISGALQLFGAFFAALGLSSGALAAEACSYRPPPIAELAPADSIADYRSVFLACGKGGEQRLAIRRMTMDG